MRPIRIHYQAVHFRILSPEVGEQHRKQVIPLHYRRLDLDWLQFAYTADRVGAYVAPASTVLVPSAVAVGDDLFPAILAHLRRRFPEVYGLGGNTAQAHERRDTPLEEGEGFSGGTSVNSSIKVGSYAGRLDNLNLVGINNPIPNLTTVYLNTPLVGPTLEPLEYVPSPGRLGQPSGYPPIPMLTG